MPWFRVLVEGSGAIRGRGGTPELDGFFTTRNAEAASAELAASMVCERIRFEMAGATVERAPRVCVRMLQTRPLHGPAEPGAGYTFYAGDPGARGEALDLEAAIFRLEPMGRLRRCWGRLTERVLAGLQRFAAALARLRGPGDGARELRESGASVGVVCTTSESQPHGTL